MVIVFMLSGLPENFYIRLGTWSRILLLLTNNISICDLKDYILYQLSKLEPTENKQLLKIASSFLTRKSSIEIRAVLSHTWLIYNWRCCTHLRSPERESGHQWGLWHVYNLLTKKTLNVFFMSIFLTHHCCPRKQHRLLCLLCSITLHLPVSVRHLGIYLPFILSVLLFLLPPFLLYFG